jgi:recombinational DNA repair protein (RecF pathway)
VMHHDPNSVTAGQPQTKRCAACQKSKPTTAFYVSRGRLSSYCKPCQCSKSAAAYRRRRANPAERQRMREADRRRKRIQRARIARTDPDRERRNGQIRTAAVRRLIAAHQAEYRSLLRAERQRRGHDLSDLVGGGQDAA